MKYWVLEKGDVEGPFEIAELKTRPGFDLGALVCPENAGSDPDRWKPASFYIEVAAATDTPPAIETSLTDTKNKKLTAGDKTSIEEYFAGVYRSENSQLSEILGIPDELENSDMNLGRFLQRELKQDTKTGRNTVNNRLARELDKENTKTGTRTFGPKGKILSRSATQPDLKAPGDFSETLKPVTARGPSVTPAKPAQTPVSNPPPAPKPAADINLAKVETLRLKKDADAPVKASPAPVRQDSPDTIFVTQAAEPAQAAAEPEETAPFNVTRTKLKAQNVAVVHHVKEKPQPRRALAVVTAVCVFIFLASVAYIFNRYKPAPQVQVLQTAVPVVPPVQAAAPVQIAVPPAAAVPAALPPPPAAKPKPASAGDKAIAIAQSYFLKAKNATVGDFLNSYFQQYRAQGYASSWSSEPLHKDIYIVKYRLTKTRVEPVVYIFEVDVKKGEVTGALNNLTLDLLDM